MKAGWQHGNAPRISIRGLIATAVLSAAMMGALPDELQADMADVTAVAQECDADQRCRFDVTVRHPDTGWKHFADRWAMLAPGGKILAVRVLQHPHVAEQPFTRSLDGIVIPAGTESILFRARCSKDGYGGAEREVRFVQ